MVINQVGVRLITRNDTSQAWREKDPILMKGEIGAEIDTGLIKIGDDIHSWSELRYINDSSGNLTSAIHYEGTAKLKEDGLTYQTDLEVITEALGQNKPYPNDLCIVKRIISNDKKSYTAYIYNGSKWTALDGNYNAQNIFFDENFIVTEGIGTIKIPEDKSNVTIEAKGKNLEEILTNILSEHKAPTVIEPSVSIELISSNNVEAGTEITPVYSATLDSGSYSYGPDTEVIATSWLITDNRNPPQASANANDHFSSLIVEDDTDYQLMVIATHSEGTIPRDNFNQEYSSLQIKEGTVSNYTETNLKSYRNYFYGALSTTTEEEPIDSKLIRSLKKGLPGGYNERRTFSIDISEFQEAKRIIIAYPENSITKDRKGLESVILPNSLNLNAFSCGAYIKQPNVNVEGANGYKAIPYIVWLYEPDSIDPFEIHNITLT